jgi:L-ascorbate metabolism protein UlaG (beta-lactamase superfamily)
MGTYYNGPKSDHFDGKHFFNPWNKRQNSWLALIRWRMTANPRPWPEHLVNEYSDVPPNSVQGPEIRVSFVGHATVLIQTQGVNILTDPIWSERAGPFNWLGPKRLTDPGISFEKLPKIDLVLISHNHYDHLDQNTIQKLWRRDKPLIVTPLGNDSIIHSNDSSIIVKTLDWGQSIKLNKEFEVYLEPAQHWSGRGFSDRDEALWGAFVIKTISGNIYFAGDTGYSDGETFRKAKAKFGRFRFAMLPIGSYEPRWFMRYGHMNPEEAVFAHQDLGRPYTLPMHFGTFRLSDESFHDPLKALDIAKRSHDIDERIQVLKVGQVWQVPEINSSIS